MKINIIALIFNAKLDVCKRCRLFSYVPHYYNVFHYNYRMGFCVGTLKRSSPEEDRLTLGPSKHVFLDTMCIVMFLVGQLSNRIITRCSSQKI